MLMALEGIDNDNEPVADVDDLIPREEAADVPPDMPPDSEEDFEKAIRPDERAPWLPRIPPTNPD
jgi:hypothetical protein